MKNLLHLHLSLGLVQNVFSQRDCSFSGTSECLIQMFCHHIQAAAMHCVLQVKTERIFKIWQPLLVLVDIPT